MMSSLVARHVHRPQHHAYSTSRPYTQCILYKQDAMITINSYPCRAVKASWSVASNVRVSHMHSSARCRHIQEKSLQNVTMAVCTGGNQSHAKCAGNMRTAQEGTVPLQGAHCWQSSLVGGHQFKALPSKGKVGCETLWTLQGH
jgi:hypothetical protein